MRILMNKRGIGANVPPEGIPIITGTARQAAKLSVDTSGISDADNIVSGFEYQWYADNVAIVGGTSSTYSPTADDIGKNLTVDVSYLDGAGFTETVKSNSVGPVLEYFTGGYIVEVNGFLASNGATIVEIRSYEENGTQRSVGTVESQYNTNTSNGQGWYGTNFWSRDNLTDGSTYYVDNSSGITSTCLFGHYGNSVTSWSRFRITTATPVARIAFWLGSPEGRNARSINVYGIVGAYNSNQLTKGYNTGLQLIETIKPTSWSVYRHDTWI